MHPYGWYMVESNLTWRNQRPPRLLMVRPRRVGHNKHRRRPRPRSQ